MLHARGTLHARNVRHDSLSPSCDTCLNACRLIAPFAEGCARLYSICNRAWNGIIIFLLLFTCAPLLCLPVHFGDSIPPSLCATPFFPSETQPGDIVYCWLREYVTYLTPVMSSISRGLLARPGETIMVVNVAFLVKRSLFTVAYAIRAKTPKMCRK